jgi:CelD/BcsL family acetyltransferase involved in cellulose biosynthesis
MQFSEKLSYLGVVLPNLTGIQSSWRARNQPRRFSTVGGLAAHWHDTMPEDSQLVMSWDHLVRALPSATAFHTSAWQAALARPYIRAGRYRLLTVHDGAEVVGVLPLQLNPGGVVETLGSMISDYLEPLVAERKAAAVWTSIVQAVGQLPGIEVNQVVLHNIRPECVNLPVITMAAARNGFAATSEPVAVTTRVPLAGTWDEYLSRLGGHDRKEIRRKIRNAQAKANAELVIPTTEADVGNGLDNVFTYMRHAGGAKGMKAQWTYRPLFKRATSGLLAAERLRIYTLRLNGADAAGLICFPGSSGPLLWAAGFDPHMSKHSPGIVLFGLALQHAISERASHFDLLRGQQRYKSELGAVESPVHRITLKRVGA